MDAGEDARAPWKRETTMSEQFPIALKITRITKHTSSVWSFLMNPANDARPEYKAGQVAVLELGEHSSYIAFASAPEDPEMEFLVKRTEKPGVANSLFEEAMAHDIALKQIAGRGFPVEAHKGCDLVFIAMGTGLAPLRSALRHAFHSRTDYGRLVVLYGVRAPEDFCYQDEMNGEWRAQGVELRQVISRPGDADWDGPTGYVQSLLDNLVPSLSCPVALVCGSKEMMEQTRTRLAELGFKADKILTNY
jgi:NAD(P)H-flavin reductase